MKESNFQTDFGNWLKTHLDYFPSSCAFELKIWKLDKSRSFPLNAVKPHQLEGLAAADGSGLYHKISDSPIFRGMRSRFTAKKPFDCMLLKDALSYIVIWPYLRGQRATDRRCYFVSLDKWLGLVNALTVEKKKSFRLDTLKDNGIELCVWG